MGQRDSDSPVESCDGRGPAPGGIDAEWPKVVDAISDCIFVLDHEQRILHCNAACARFSDRGSDDLIGRHCWEVVHGTDAPVPECPFRRMRSSRQRESMELEQGGHAYLVTVDPIATAPDSPVGAVHIAHDITEQKKVARELEARVRERTAQLKESEATYRGLLENTFDIPFRIDAAGVVTYIGPQVLRYGFEPAALAGRPFLDTVFTEDQAGMATAFRRTLDSGIAHPTQFRIQVADGSLYWFEERSTAQRASGGAIAGVTGMLRDITQRKNEERIRMMQEQRLHELAAKLASAQDDEQRRIADGLHDDVAQLLTASLMKMAVARRTPDPREAETARAELEDLVREANQKLRLLSFELASSTLHRLSIEEALEELCEGMSERYGVRFNIQTNHNRTTLDEACATVLFKAARELLFNVVKHAGVQEATVHLDRSERHVRLQVKDNGTGFPLLDAGGAQPKTDKGLGLFGIQERLLDLGGKVDIRSTPENGTEVTLWVPIRTQ